MLSEAYSYYAERRKKIEARKDVSAHSRPAGHGHHPAGEVVLLRRAAQASEELAGDARQEDGFPWVIFWTAFLVRIAVMTLGHFYRIAPYEDHFKFGYEMGRVARSLATGQGYANPFDHPSGPTA